MLKVYFCLLPEEARAIPTARLSAYRREKLAKQKNERMRLLSAASELLLRHALEDCGFSADEPPEIAVGAYGKPFLQNGACFFSLSHSGGALLCALCDEEIGADIQATCDPPEALIRRFFAAEEQARVFAAEDPAAAFTEIWTKKESFCKRDGRGLALPLASFSVFDEAIAPLLWHRTAGEYHICVCSDAVRTEKPELIEVKASALFP